MKYYWEEGKDRYRDDALPQVERVTQAPYPSLKAMHVEIS
jgi:hypothetical protein